MADYFPFYLNTIELDVTLQGIDFPVEQVLS